MRGGLLTALMLCAAASAAAHDFWIEPATMRPAPGEVVEVRLRVGDHFQGEPVLRNNTRIERFIIRDEQGERAIAGAHGADPAGAIEAGQRGAILGFRSNPVRHGQMPAQRFESYLREEGLESIVSVRRARGHAQRPGREIYSRSAKALLRCPGSCGPMAYDEPLGFRLEIIPLGDPHAAGPLRARLLFEGKPLPGVRVAAMRRGHQGVVSARSGTDGGVTLPLSGAGVWLIKAVHMFEAPPGVDADWESIWASLTVQRDL